MQAAQAARDRVEQQRSKLSHPGLCGMQGSLRVSLNGLCSLQLQFLLLLPVLSSLSGLQLLL